MMVKTFLIKCDRCGGGLHTCQTNKKSARKYGLESGWTNAEGDKKTWYCGGCMKVINERVELVKRVKNGR